MHFFYDDKILKEQNTINHEQIALCFDFLA